MTEKNMLLVIEFVICAAIFFKMWIPGIKYRKQGVKVTGQVTRKEVEHSSALGNRTTVTYRYSYHEVSYPKSFTRYGNIRGMDKGDEIEVYCMPEDPKDACPVRDCYKPMLALVLCVILYAIAFFFTWIKYM